MKLSVLGNSNKVIDLNERRLYRDLSFGVSNQEDINVHSLHFDKAYILQGEILLSLGRYNEAIKAFNLALEINPMSSSAYSSLAFIYDMKNSSKEALFFNQKAFEVFEHSGFNQKAFEVFEHSGEDKVFLLSLYDQKMSILSKENMLEEMKKTIFSAQQNLSQVDFDYIVDCYKDYFSIDSSRKLYAI